MLDAAVRPLSAAARRIVVHLLKPFAGGQMLEIGTAATAIGALKNIIGYDRQGRRPMAQIHNDWRFKERGTTAQNATRRGTGSVRHRRTLR